MWLSTRPCEAEDETITGHGKLQRKVKEFSPQFRRVQLEGLRLLLTGPNGIHETIYLQGCDVKAFSETEDFKKKWYVLAAAASKQYGWYSRKARIIQASPEQAGLRRWMV